VEERRGQFEGIPMTQSLVWTHGLTFDTTDVQGGFYGPPPSGNVSEYGYTTRLPIGSTFSPTGPGQYYFLAPLSTPSLLQDYFLQLESVHLLFMTQDAEITSIQLTHGVTALEPFEDLGWTGDHTTPDKSQFQIFPQRQDLSTGLCAGIVVNFSASTQPKPRNPCGSVLFVAIGVGLVTGKKLDPAALASRRLHPGI
jgi:hypothetical protein